MARSLPHYRDFRRIAAPAEVAQQLIPKTIPAPTRGLVLNENPAFMQPGAALVLDNWFVTENAIRMRGGSRTWSSLPSTTPVMSLFTYITANIKKMFAASDTMLYDVSSSIAAAVGAFTLTNGHFSTVQMSNMGGDWLTAVNDAGDYPLRFNGTTWVQLDAAFAGTPGSIRYPGTPTVAATGLTAVWTYKRRLFFIQGGTMNAWYLDLDEVGGTLTLVPLSGAFTKGGSLLFGATWTVSAGDGIGDKCIFVTDEGEIAVFSGTNPNDAANWAQQGRYQVGKPLGKNAWLNIGGDVLIATLDGLVPISQALVKDPTALEFAALSRVIHPLWDADAKQRSDRPWNICKWDEYGGLFVTSPGGSGPAEWRCFVANTVTGGWSRFTGWDALNFCVVSGNMFFGTQDGRIVQADLGGYDYSANRPTGSNVEAPDGPFPFRSYSASYVNGWEVFGSPPFTFTFRQARVTFNTKAGEPFVPQVTCSIDYIVMLPPPPAAGQIHAAGDVWDEGLWGTGAIPPPPEPPLEPNEIGRARWDAGTGSEAHMRTTMWVSIGETGRSHAPQLQTTIFQPAKPDIEVLGISMLAEKCGIAV